MEHQLSSKPKDVWDKVQTGSVLIASITIPLVALVVGNLVSTSQKESENRIKYTEIAVSILRTEPTDSTTALREWAVEILAVHSAVPLSPAAKEELKNQQVNLGYGFSTYSPQSPVKYEDINDTHFYDAATYSGKLKFSPKVAASAIPTK